MTHTDVINQSTTPVTNRDLIVNSLITSSYGRYEVYVYDNDQCAELGKFFINDAQKHDDINTYNEHRCDEDLRYFESGHEIKEWALSQLK